MEALGGYSDELFFRLVAFVTSIIPSYHPSKIISGMAIGFDQALALAALELEIPLIAAVPFVGQESIWPQAAKNRYHEILKQAAEVVIVCEGGFAPHKFEVRNRWMIDNAESVLALWNGMKSGGTWNAVKYATSVKKPLFNLWPGWESLSFANE